MIKTSIDIDQVIATLNEMVALDPQAARALVETRVPCANVLADHPTIQVQDSDRGKPIVGFLGVLNGLFGTDDEGWGPICAVFEDDGTLSSFKRTPRAQIPVKE